MTKRLGLFLGLGLVGVVLLLTGLAWDAVAHANDPSLAGREGIFTLGNPGHVLLGLGIGLVLVGLIGGCETLLVSAAEGPWARPGVHRAFLAVSTAVVLSAAGVTSWAGQAGHDSPAAGKGHNPSEQLAASPDGSHGQAAPVGGDAPEAHSGPGAEQAGAAENGAVSHEGRTSTSVVHDHIADRSGPAATPKPGTHRHEPPTTAAAGRADQAEHSHEAAASAAQPGDHQHGSPKPQSPAAPPGPEGPQGSWADLRYGPFVVTPAGAGGDADHANIAVPSLPKPCSNCFVLEFKPELVYADGTPANLDSGMMLHHTVLFSAGRQDHLDDQLVLDASGDAGLRRLAVQHGRGRRGAAVAVGALRRRGPPRPCSSPPTPCCSRWSSWCASSRSVPSCAASTRAGSRPGGGRSTRPARGANYWRRVGGGGGRQGDPPLRVPVLGGRGVHDPPLVQRPAGRRHLRQGAPAVLDHLPPGRHRGRGALRRPGPRRPRRPAVGVGAGGGPRRCPGPLHHGLHGLRGVLHRGRVPRLDSLATFQHMAARSTRGGPAGVGPSPPRRRCRCWSSRGVVPLPGLVRRRAPRSGPAGPAGAAPGRRRRQRGRQDDAAQAARRLLRARAGRILVDGRTSPRSTRRSGADAWR